MKPTRKLKTLLHYKCPDPLNRRRKASLKPTTENVRMFFT